jgi:2-oxoglutarate dehydrogenase E1 component
MTDFSFIANAHTNYIENLYNDYLTDPDSVPADWKAFFAGFEYASGSNSQITAALNGTTVSGAESDKEIAVARLIHSYRSRGHLLSTTNPIRPRRDRAPHLNLSDFNLTESDLSQVFSAGSELGLSGATLQQIINRLDEIYCGHIGYEYAYINNYEKRSWLQQKIEEHHSKDYNLTGKEKKQILQKLNEAVMFEEFLHTKYVGQKRFSLEGGETTIAAMDAMINYAVSNGVEEVVIGMAHRGRLNVLANILGKTYEQIFTEFEGTSIPDQSFGNGDVKYHQGFSSMKQVESGKNVYLKLVPNPSHLEAVDPVVEGFSRAKADVLYDSKYDRILPILLHGDSAIAGQGVVYETVQFSQLKGYKTGGTIHYVINNQIGFTTDFDDARSSTYCTAAAYLVQAPVFHVNGDDPEAVVFVSKLAAEYRQKFNNDVFIDMVCYRKHGHNEGDDPKFTQPKMYDIIAKHPNPREIYLKYLESRGDITATEAEEMEKQYWAKLQDKLDLVKEAPLPYTYQEPELAWKSLRFAKDSADFDSSPDTGIAMKTLEQIIGHLNSYPENFHPLSKVHRLLKTSQKLADERKMDWAMAELSAYGSLLLEGNNVRMSGQDVKRGTFSHRHAIFIDAETQEEYNRLANLSDKQGKFMIYNSLLSEFAVLGFEYGYAMANPGTLVLWEAQFGDFSNGAQTIIDQFVSSGESKWHRMNGLVMLLPHGYEGQGAEHSSARLERYLDLIGEYNISIVNATTPANFFHVLRRQLIRPFRKPLIVMSPKSLLRHPECISGYDEFKSGSKFQEVIDEAELKTKSADIKKVLLCSGKVYYDLLAYRRELNINDVAICRLEQLYPFPDKQLNKLFAKYKKAQWTWVQEEPANMGAISYLIPRLPATFSWVSRPISAAPATGYKKVHDQQQKTLIQEAFANLE